MQRNVIRRTMAIVLLTGAILVMGIYVLHTVVIPRALEEVRNCFVSSRLSNLPEEKL